MSAANLEDYLPALFRKRRVNPELPQNIEPSNILAPQEPVAPLTIVPTVPATDSAKPPTVVPPAANPDYVGTMVQPNIAAPQPDVSTRPHKVETDTKGRPIANTTMQGDTQAVDLNQRLHNYQPQAAHGWWDKWGKQMVTGALRGLQYGPGGAIGGAVSSGIRGKLNPTLGDEQWKAGELAKSDPEVSRIASQQALKTKVAQAALEADKTKAETYNLTHPKPIPGHPTLTDSGWALMDTNSGNLKPVIDPVTGKQAQGHPTGAKEEWVHDENGIAHKWSNGKDTGQLDPGRNLKLVPGYGLVPPGQAMNADATAGNRAQERGDKSVEAQTAYDEAVAAETDALTRHKDATERIAALRTEQAKFDPEEPQWKQYDGNIRELEGEARSAQSDASRFAVTKRAKKAELARYSNKVKPKNDPLGLFQ